MKKAENRTVITVGSGGFVVEIIFSASGLGRTTIADKRSSQKPCACVGNKILAERLGDILHGHVLVKTLFNKSPVIES